MFQGKKMSTKKAARALEGSDEAKRTPKRERPSNRRCRSPQAEVPNAAVFCQGLTSRNTFFRLGGVVGQTSGNCNDGVPKGEEPRLSRACTACGDGPRPLETEDTEVLCITVCNPYSSGVDDFTRTSLCATRILLGREPARRALREINPSHDLLRRHSRATPDPRILRVARGVMMNSARKWVQNRISLLQAVHKAGAQFRWTSGELEQRGRRQPRRL